MYKLLRTAAREFRRNEAILLATPPVQLNAPSRAQVRMEEYLRQGNGPTLEDFVVAEQLHRHYLENQIIARLFPAMGTPLDHLRSYLQTRAIKATTGATNNPVTGIGSSAHVEVLCLCDSCLLEEVERGGHGAKKTENSTSTTTAQSTLMVLPTTTGPATINEGKNIKATVACKGPRTPPPPEDTQDNDKDKTVPE